MEASNESFGELKNFKGEFDVEEGEYRESSFRRKRRTAYLVSKLANVQFNHSKWNIKKTSEYLQQQATKKRPPKRIYRFKRQQAGKGLHRPALNDKRQWNSVSNVAEHAPAFS